MQINFANTNEEMKELNSKTRLALQVLLYKQKLFFALKFDWLDLSYHINIQGDHYVSTRNTPFHK